MPQWGTLNSLNALRDWFETASEQNTTNWVLYHGHQMKAQHGAKNAEQKDSLAFEESWQVLEAILHPQVTSGGNFTLYVLSKNGNPGPRAFLSVPSGTQPGMNGINSASYIEKEIQNFKENYTLRQEIEALKNEIRAKQNPLELMVGQLIESGAAAQIVAGLIGKVSGISQEATIQAMPELHGNGEIGKIEAALDRIAKHFPDLGNALEKLASFVEENPELAKNLLNGNGNYTT